MKAIVVETPGDASVLKLQDIDAPAPGRGQARIKVEAIGLNFIDIYYRRGQYQIDLPYTPGQEASGTVDAVGTGVSVVKPGDRVAYCGTIGAYAEFAIVPADKLIPLPDDMSFQQGAAFPLQGMTAHYLIHEYKTIKPGDTVLIHAAAGGMGLLLVQWAKHKRARVIGTVSTEEKERAAREAGADEVIRYTDVDFVDATKRLTSGKGADLIIDGVGKTTFPGDLEACAVRGNIVIYGSASGQAEPVSPNSFQARSLTISGGRLNNYLLTRDELLERAHDVLRGIREGWLNLKVEHILGLGEASQAHNLLESRLSSGKILLTP